jgi:hypothetical protein
MSKTERAPGRSETPGQQSVADLVGYRAGLQAVENSDLPLATKAEAFGFIATAAILANTRRDIRALQTALAAEQAHEADIMAKLAEIAMASERRSEIVAILPHNLGGLVDEAVRAQESS